MKTHKPTCLRFLCTCDFNDELKKSKDSLDKMRNLLQELEAYVEANDRLFEDKHISPEDVEFLRDVNKKKNSHD
jgi:hypothetical protein